MKKKLFVLSMDAMVREDIAYLEAKPNFKKLWKSRWDIAPSLAAVLDQNLADADGCVMTELLK